MHAHSLTLAKIDYVDYSLNHYYSLSILLLTRLSRITLIVILVRPLHTLLLVLCHATNPLKLFQHLLSTQ